MKQSHDSVRPACFDRPAGGFTLVELLVVIGIIAVLIGILLPSLSRAQAQAKSVQCMSNLRQIGMELGIYANNNKGWMYPPSRGANVPIQERWPVFVFKIRPDVPTNLDPENWTPKVMRCPSDPTDVSIYQGINPVVHSYVVNDHLKVNAIKFSSKDLGGLSSTQVIVMGEKTTGERDYYMNIIRNGAGGSDFSRVVEKYRHGLRIGSNYLYMDYHVSTAGPADAIKGVDPWDVPVVDEETPAAPLSTR